MFTTFFFITNSFCIIENPDQIDYAQYWFLENPVPQIMITKQDNPREIMHTVYMITVLISSYLLSMFIAKKTLNELNQQSSRLSSKTKDLQKQLAKFVCFFLLINDNLERCSFNRFAHFVSLSE
jgi:hypothetical protein